MSGLRAGVRAGNTDDADWPTFTPGYYTGRDDVGYQSYRMPSRVERTVQSASGLPHRVARTLRDPSKIVRVVTRRKERPWPYSLVDIVGQYSRVGTILDVGCATGLFLAAARESGWQPQGVELSEYSSSRAREELGLDVFTGTLQRALEAGHVREGNFHVVTMWDTVEHLVDPMAAFTVARRALKPGGLLFVETLNIDGDRAIREGQGWHFFRPPKHLFYYGESTLNDILKALGSIQ